MKKLLIIIILSTAIMISCSRPMDNTVIINVKDSDISSQLITTIGNTSSSVSTTTVYISGERLLVINKSTKKIHLSGECAYVNNTLEENKQYDVYDNLYTYLQKGYQVCSYCKNHY